MDKSTEKKIRFFDKNTTVFSIICILIITIVGSLMLYFETADKSVIIKSEESVLLQSEIDQASSSDGYNPEVHGLININTADLETLMVLDGIGEKKAEAIIEYRTKRPFKSVSDIMNVSGIGQKTYEKIKDSICVK